MHREKLGYESMRDGELERLAAFRALLDKIAWVEPVTVDTYNSPQESPVKPWQEASTRLAVDLHDDQPLRAAADRFRLYHGRQTVEPTLFLADTLPLEEAVTEHTPVFMPFISRVGKRSAHGVFFGELSLGERTIEVAVKPHNGENSLETCLRDYLANIVIERTGLQSLEPVGFVIAGDSAYSLTRLDRGLTTLDSIDWSTFSKSFNQHPGMLTILSQLARQTASMHDRGSISHGDMAGRNAAIRTDNTSFWIDWEHATISMRTPRDAESRFQTSFVDLQTFIESLCLPPDHPYKAGLGVFEAGYANWWQGIKEIFFDEYMSTREALLLEANGRLSAAEKMEIKEELGQLEAHLKDFVSILQSNLGA